MNTLHNDAEFNSEVNERMTQEDVPIQRIKPQQIKDFKLFNFLFDLCRERMEEIFITDNQTLRQKESMKIKVQELINQILDKTKEGLQQAKLFETQTDDVESFDERKMEKINEVLCDINSMHEIIEEFKFFD